MSISPSAATTRAPERYEDRSSSGGGFVTRRFELFLPRERLTEDDVRFGPRAQLDRVDEPFERRAELHPATVEGAEGLLERQPRSRAPTSSCSRYARSRERRASDVIRGMKSCTSRNWLDLDPQAPAGVEERHGRGCAPGRNRPEHDLDRELDVVDRLEAELEPRCEPARDEARDVLEALDRQGDRHGITVHDCASTRARRLSRGTGDRGRGPDIPTLGAPKPGR
jgi:hypothetical protein